MKFVTWSRVPARMTMRVLSMVLGVLLFSLALLAQANFGRILGTVTDQTGGVLAGATVSVIDKDRGLARTLTTDAAGEYNAPTLIPGTYTVRVEARGFKRLDRENIVLEVGKEIRVDLTPQPGEQAQSVTITEAIPLVETASSTLGGTLSNAEINDLPLNGRNYQNLLNLRPGVMIQPGGSPWSQSTNNIRPDETAWMMDGVLNVNFWDARPVGNAPSAFTDMATIVPIDAIQEFNLEENPKAEYGWKPGAVVNVGIRSGTNTFHGSAYAFGRDQDWDARNLFNQGVINGTCAPNPGIPSVCDKLPTDLEQYGGVAGGRIKKDKLFFFAGYEGMRNNIGNAFVFSVPATGTGLGPKNSMVDAIKALQKANVAISPVSLKLAGCTVGAALACTGGLYQGAGANTTNYFASFPNTNVTDNGIGKIDYRINDKHMINGMLWTGDYKADGMDHPIVNEIFKTPITLRTWTTVENWIWTPSSSVVNEARFGYNRAGQTFGIDDPGSIPDGSGGLCTATGCGGKGYPINTGVKTGGGLPNIDITGFGGSLGSWRGRPGSNTPNPYYDIQDIISYLRGKHALKFGGEFAHIEADADPEYFRGRIQFRGKGTSGLTDCGGKSCPLEDFFAGNPNRAFLNVGSPVRTMTWTKTAAFVQDDWRIKPKFMLNLGLRYEYASPIREVNNLLGNFDPALGLVQQGQPSVGDTLWKPDRKNFSPRVGFAWDVTGRGTTVVRGGASVIYSSFFAASFMGSTPQNGAGGSVGAVPTGACKTVVAPGVTCPQTLGGTINYGQANLKGSLLNWDPKVSATPGLNGGTVFPQGAGINCAGVASCSVLTVDPNLKTPYIVNYNFDIQHAITSNLSLQVGYIGNHGDNLTGVLDINQCAPNPKGDCVRPYDGHPGSLGNFPYLKYINHITNYARSNYNSLQTTLTKRLSHGLNFTAGYTYGHGLDNGSLNRFGNTPQNSSNPNAEYASGDFDIRHRLTLTASYAIPGKKGFGQVLEGWKLNTIVNLQSPQPWMAWDTGNDFSTGGSSLGDLSDRWNFYGNPSDFKSGSSSLPFCPQLPDPKDPTTFCSVTSGISSIQSNFSFSQSTAMWAQCTAKAPDMDTLNAAGCFVKGNSVMVPPKNGTFGTMGRNMFRDTGFKNVDFSLFKDFKFKERFGAQFRVEVFNLFNHPIIANPFGSSNGSQLGNDISSGNTFGGGGATPDVAAGNPIVGSGSSRVMQLGLKLTF